MAKVEGLEKLIAALRKKAAAAVKDSDVSVAVGYTAAYALYVHENMAIWPPGMRLAGLPRSGEVRRVSGSGNDRVVSYGHAASKKKGFYWDPQGRAQPKFLETPFRENAKLYARIITNACKRGNTIAQALVLAGMQLQRDSQLLVPVDLGNLKASAFTRLEVPARRSGGTDVGDAGSQSE